MKNFEALDLVYQFLVACTSSLRDKKTPSRNANFIAVTYKSFRKLTAYLTLHTHKFRVFIDESQNFTTSTSPSYLLKELKEVIQLSTAYQSTTLLTGTYSSYDCTDADYSGTYTKATKDGEALSLFRYPKSSRTIIKNQHRARTVSDDSI